MACLWFSAFTSSMLWYIQDLITFNHVYYLKTFSGRLWVHSELERRHHCCFEEQACKCLWNSSTNPTLQVSFNSLLFFLNAEHVVFFHLTRYFSDCPLFYLPISLPIGLSVFLSSSAYLQLSVFKFNCSQKIIHQA